MKWYKVDGEFKPEGEVLAKDKYNSLLIGKLIKVNNAPGITKPDYECSSEDCILYDVTHFIPVSELLINIEEKK